MLTDTAFIKCEHCDYKTQRRYNLLRHVELKHSREPTERHPQNCHQPPLFCPQPPLFCPQPPLFCPQPPLFCSESPLFCSESPLFCPQRAHKLYQCTSCKKTFGRSDILSKHVAVCKGIRQTSCIYCQKAFDLPCRASRHMATCNKRVDKPKEDRNEIVPATQQAQCINATGCSKVQQNNTTNNFNLVVYNTRQIDFNSSHIDVPMLTEILRSSDGDTSSSDYNKEVLAKYSRALLGNKENQCVRKTNLRSSHSQVHVGNNNWESRHDKEVFPKVVCSVANQMSDNVYRLQDEKPLKAQKRMLSRVQTFLEYMSDEGYAEDIEKEKEMNREFRRLVQDLKLIFADLTKLPAHCL